MYWKLIKHESSESSARHKMETAKAKIQRVNPGQFITYCLKINNQIFKDRVEMLQHLPWIVNLAIKWSGAAMNKKKSFRNIDEKEARRLIQQSYEALDFIPMDFKTKEGLSFLVRNSVYQQGIYQHGDLVNSISRQAFIFNRLDKNNSLNARFEDCTGISIQDFITLSSMVLAMNMQNHSTRLTINDFVILSEIYTQKTIENFLHTISISIEDLPSFATENTNTTPLKEYYSPTPFLYKPYIRQGGDLLQIHPALTAKSLQNFVYDYLRKDNIEKFMDKFGAIYENAIADMLTYHKVSFISEKELTNILPVESKVVDFVISNDDSNIFIDSKAIEINQKGMVTLKAGDISSSIKTSVLKTLEQALTVNSHIHLKDTSPIKPKDKSYIICITFKNLLLGYGKLIYESFAKWEMDKIYKRYEEDHRIPYENIFCLSFEEFEYLLASCEKYQKHISEVLDYAINKNKNPLTSSFFFIQHLQSFFGKIIPSDIVHKEGVDVLDTLASKLPELRKRFEILSSES